MFYLEGVDAMGQAQDATEPAPKRQRTFASAFAELEELHKTKDDGVIDGQEFERLKGLLMSELERFRFPARTRRPIRCLALAKNTQPRPDAERT